MLKYGNKEFRNLEEQVEKNKSDILFILEEEGVLNQFGIKVVAEIDDIEDLPTVEEYKEEHEDWEYGDAYAVGDEPPHTLYVLTRANGTHPDDYWFNIGEFPMPGPQGEQGEEGPQGEQGEQGEQGIQGDPGDDGLAYSDQIDVTYISLGTVINLDGSKFNRLPKLGDYFIGVVRNTNDGKIYLAIFEVINSPQTPVPVAQCEVQSVLNTQGPDGIAGQAGNFYKEVYEMSDDSLTSYTFDPTKFTSLPTPQTGFASLVEYDNEIYAGIFTITSTVVGTTTATKNSMVKIQGPQGIQGIQGIQGEQGVQGEQGIQGIQGEQGPQGPQGEQGIQGIQGEQGIQGIQGEQGPQGPQGLQGLTGETGSAALMYYPVIETSGIGPSVTYHCDYDDFNRKPQVDETFIALINYSNNTQYIGSFVVNSLSEYDQYANCTTQYYAQVNGATGLSPIYASIYVWTSAPLNSINEYYYSFSRTPVVGDIFLMIWEATSTSKKYLTQYKVTALSSSYAVCDLEGSIDITGPQGPQGPAGGVNSVNGETGEVVLTASDINATNTQSIQANLERIDAAVEGVIDDLADKQASISSIELNGATTNTVTYNSLEGINIVGTGEINGTDTISTEFNVPILPGNGIVIDATSSDDAVEIKVDPTTLASKQDVLTAGSNITITNNVISATASDNLVEVAYGSKTAAQIKDMIDAGKLPYVVNSDQAKTKCYFAGQGLINTVLYFVGFPTTALGSTGFTKIKVSSSGWSREFIYYAETSELTTKQDTLVSGTNIKTINNESLLGSGNITIEGSDIDSTGATSGQVLTADGSGGASWQTSSGGSSKFVEITYGTTTFAEITSYLSQGLIPYFKKAAVFPELYSHIFYYASARSSFGTSLEYVFITFEQSAASSNIPRFGMCSVTGTGWTAIEYTSYQDTLVSGTNIKTVNNQSLLGSGDITISGGGLTKYTYTFTYTGASSMTNTILRNIIAIIDGGCDVVLHWGSSSNNKGDQMYTPTFTKDVDNVIIACFTANGIATKETSWAFQGNGGIAFSNQIDPITSSKANFQYFHGSGSTINVSDIPTNTTFNLTYWASSQIV